MAKEKETAFKQTKKQEFIKALELIPGVKGTFIDKKTSLAEDVAQKFIIDQSETDLPGYVASKGVVARFYQYESSFRKLGQRLPEFLTMPKFEEPPETPPPQQPIGGEPPPQPPI